MSEQEEGDDVHGRSLWYKDADVFVVCYAMDSAASFGSAASKWVCCSQSVGCRAGAKRVVLVASERRVVAEREDGQCCVVALWLIERCGMSGSRARLVGGRCCKIGWLVGWAKNCACVNPTVRHEHTFGWRTPTAPWCGWGGWHSRTNRNARTGT